MPTKWATKKTALSIVKAMKPQALKKIIGELEMLQNELEEQKEGAAFDSVGNSIYELEQLLIITPDELC